MSVSVQTVLPAEREFVAECLERVFADCFAADLRTRLLSGAEEPFYQPAIRVGDFHMLSYREDYFASALHEVAHWCIAGPARRQLVDFGYWYSPDGRSESQQQAFEAVEYQPQALEWYFSRACAYRFRVSVDNLDAQTGELPDTSGFRRRVYDQVVQWQRDGLPARAAIFFEGLCREFGTAIPPEQLHFSLAELD
jgi:elongation factor P hydroxylase